MIGSFIIDRIEIGGRSKGSIAIDSNRTNGFEFLIGQHAGRSVVRTKLSYAGTQAICRKMEGKAFAPVWAGST